MAARGDRRPSAGTRIRDPRAAAFALVLAVLGGMTVTLGLTTEDAAPLPAGSAAAMPSPAIPSSPASATGSHTPPPTAGLQRSTPVRLRIPGIGVDTALMTLGLRDDGTLQVPPLRGDAPAGWYKHSPTPGETGTSVLVGHVDTARDGPAVFYRLRELSGNDQVEVRRADGTVARFTVTRVVVFAKDEFPSAEVYAATGRPALRLITCGGVFDRGAGSYRSNVVVFADAVT